MYYARNAVAKQLEASYGLCVAVASNGYHLVGWAAAVGGGIVSLKLQRHAVSSLKMAVSTSGALLQDHSLKFGEVWAAVKPSKFQQPTLGERLTASQSTVREVIRQHGPAVLRVTCRGALSLCVIGAMQPLVTAGCCFATSQPLPVPKAAEAAPPEDVQERFRRQIALSAGGRSSAPRGT